MKDVTVYTDGSSKGNPGPGGYAAVLIYGDHRKEISKGFRKTTNNRMEMMAAIAALRSLKYPCGVTIHSDSQYLVNAMEKGWLKKWLSNGWKTSEKKDVLNVDLWKELVELTRFHNVRFNWVRGHDNNPENERCDELAVAAAEGSELAVDEGYENAP